LLLSLVQGFVQHFPVPFAIRFHVFQLPGIAEHKRIFHGQVDRHYGWSRLLVAAWSCIFGIDGCRFLVICEVVSVSAGIAEPIEATTGTVIDHQRLPVLDDLAVTEPFLEGRGIGLRLLAGAETDVRISRIERAVVTDSRFDLGSIKWNSPKDRIITVSNNTVIAMLFQ